MHCYMHWSHSKLDLSGNAIEGTLDLGDGTAARKDKPELVLCVPHWAKACLRMSLLTWCVRVAVANDWPVLTELDLTGNRFQGSIPAVLETLQQLRKLGLGNCGFSGEPPPHAACKQ